MPLTVGVLRLQPDARLVALARDGYERPFAELVRRHSGAMAASASELMGDRQSWRAVHEAVLQARIAIRDADIGVVQRRPRAWLTTIVREVALQDLGRMPTRPPSEQAGATLAAANGTVESRSLRQHLGSLVPSGVVQLLLDASRGHPRAVRRSRGRPRRRSRAERKARA